MRCYVVFLLTITFFPLTKSRATEEHLLTVYQALTTSAEAIGPVTYVTWYGALEESTVEAVCWPAVLASPHKDAVLEDVNWASVLGIQTRLEQVQEGGWKLTLDLTKLKLIPESLNAKLVDQDGARVKALEWVVQAIEKNLKMLGVFDCAVSVLGEQAHDDLKAFAPPMKLNAVVDSWGPWTYTNLRKTYPDGDLHQLAAGSLVVPERLHTIFLILSSETASAEGQKDMTALLKALLARIGDQGFAAVLKEAESEVQKHILKALAIAPTTASAGDPGLAWRDLFPRTFAIGIKD